LDTALTVTRGAPLSLTQLFTSLHPNDQIFTGVYEPEGSQEKLIGQIYRSQTMTNAHMLFLLQCDNVNSRDFVILLEGLIKQAGHWGAKQVVANLDITSELFPHFRQAGFSVLAKQRVFQCEPSDLFEDIMPNGWRTWRHEDINAMRGLYQTLVPPLIQAVEPISRREAQGLVHYDPNGALVAYADLIYGPVGVWVLPVIHPQINENMGDLLNQMVLDVRKLNKKPIFIASRSYQPWVESALEEIALEASPEQAVMVRYLALRQRVKSTYVYSPVENGQPEPTITLSSVKERHNG
jgi:hypothetical protein